MKKVILFLLLFNWISVYAQTPVDVNSGTMIQAKFFLDKSKPYYNPTLAYGIYNKFAAQGNAEAMNGLGVMYSQGLVVTMDDQKSFEWFTKAVQNGYGNAYYNLGMLYKNALGVPQDFTKAYEIFKEGAAINSASSIYAQGYMLFKGLGCQQSYDQAVQLFKKCVNMNELGSMYMLGICYRNGYGIQANLDSAKYWLTKSSKAGYHFATDELGTADPENTNISNVEVIQPVSNDQKSLIPDLKNGYQTVSHNLPVNNIAGEYQGFIIKFDWSGKHVINEYPLNLTLARNGETLSGQWVEDGNISTQVQATLTDTAVVFDNTAYTKPDHYNEKSPNDFVFKHAKLLLYKNASNVIITGNLQLYSTKLKEPEKPTFIMLMRSSSNTDSINNISTVAKTDSVKFIIYPNPFMEVLHANFTIKKAGRVRVIVSNLMNSAIVYQSNYEQLEAGDYTRTFQINGLSGTYVCTLDYGGTLKSAIVFKQ